MDRLINNFLKIDISILNYEKTKQLQTSTNSRTDLIPTPPQPGTNQQPLHPPPQQRNITKPHTIPNPQPFQTYSPQKGDAKNPSPTNPIIYFSLSTSNRRIYSGQYLPRPSPNVCYDFNQKGECSGYSYLVSQESNKIRKPSYLHDPFAAFSIYYQYQVMINPTKTSA